MIWLVLPLLLLGCASPSPFAGVKNLYEAKGTTIVCFGDSITAGNGALSGEDYPARLGQTIKLPVINLGVSGDTTESALLRIEEIFKYDPRIVIVELGGNDYIRRFPSSKTFDDLRQIVEKIQEKKAVAVLISMPLGPGYGSGYKDLAKKKGAVLIPSVMGAIFDDKNLMADELHPNSRGYEKLAEEIAKVIDPLLEEMGP
ncbi:arylesterase [Candidatus Saganbacteria bacterium]|nr:arylesterase [Candidatus Saganbacteria bacterium]